LITIVVLLLYNTIYLNASVGTYKSAALASNALVGVSHVGIMVTSVVYFIFLKVKHILRAGHNTQVTALAALGVDRYCSMNFCHIILKCFS